MKNIIIIVFLLFGLITKGQVNPPNDLRRAVMSLNQEVKNYDFNLSKIETVNDYKLIIKIRPGNQTITDQTDKSFQMNGTLKWDFISRYYLNTQFRMSGRAVLQNPYNIYTAGIQFRIPYPSKSKSKIRLFY